MQQQLFNNVAVGYTQAPRQRKLLRGFNRVADCSGSEWRFKMEYQLKDKSQVIPLVKRMYWLAWQACGGPLGMGALQDHPQATEEEVFVNVVQSEDYAIQFKDLEAGEAYADYVFGRMMKLGVKFNRVVGTVTLFDRVPSIDYQAWCGKYRTERSLLESAATDLCIEFAGAKAEA